MARPTKDQILAAPDVSAYRDLALGNVNLSGCIGCVDCANSKGCNNCVNVAASRYLERCSRASNSTHSTDCRFVDKCHHSTNCIGMTADRASKLYECNNCESCDNCAFCDNLKGAKNVVIGVQLTAAEFATVWTKIEAALAAEQAAEDASAG